MEVRQYTLNDYQMIAEWYIERRMTPPKSEQLPVIGFVVDGTAAGFLYNADGKLALLEGYIASPRSSAYLRDVALDLITENLINAAKKLGVNKIFAASSLRAIQRRAEVHGFKGRPTMFLVKELE